MRHVAVLAAALATVPAGTPASAQQPICVAVVVDYRELRGGVSTYCAKVAPGTTGSGVLAARARALGRPQPQYRSDGLICTIDGLPEDGCAATDSSHYWAYYYRLPGETAWRYSNKGPATRKPRDTESEGWVWTGGTGQGARQPATVPYATACPPEPAPTTAPPTVAPRPTTGAPVPGTTPTTRRPSRPARTTTTSAVATAGAATPAAVVTPAPGRTPSTARPASSAPETGPADDTLLTATDAPGGGFPWGAAGGLGLVVGLGAAAAHRRRRA